LGSQTAKFGDLCSSEKLTYKPLQILTHGVTNSDKKLQLICQKIR